MAKVEKGDRLVCVPCGREVVVDCCGVSSATLWCCDKPMQPSPKSQAKRKTAKK